MKLRKLELKDAPLMLEWMHDTEIIRDLQTNFTSKSLKDCVEFIEQSQDTSKEMHLAIVDESDEYMGTVSLKHITKNDAEFAITIRKKAMGKNLSKNGMAEIIRIGLEDLGLNKIYWCVNGINSRAVRFYDKNNYQRIDIKNSELLNSVRYSGCYTDQQIDEYIWYEVE